MRARRYFKYLIPILFLSCFILMAKNDKEASKLYQEAKKASIQRDWDKAINLFQDLIDTFPDSKYTDDAHFWVGYCLEKKGGQNIEAFLRYDKLIQDFPESPWTDDARVHQVFVAESLAQEGKQAYRIFLTEQLTAEDTEIRNRAAISLGKLGDKNAQPHLESLKEHETFGKLAQNLIAALDAPETEPELQKGITIEVTPEIRKQQIEKKDSKWGFILPPSKDYKYYRMMLRNDNQWNKEDLIDFGMWTILPTDEFEEYFNLTGFDRSEWLRKYWKRRDPTPTTDENECWLEYEKRILHARANFGQLWNAKHLKYLRDQYNREGWPNAPWDARGELYIKYGEPDFSSIADFNIEEWTYYNHSTDFLVHRYMTNIYGDAIAPGPMANFNYRDDLSWFESKFEYGKEFIYHHDYKADPLKNTEVNISESTSKENPGIIIEYTFPSKELSHLENNTLVRYVEKWIVLDEDMKPLKEGEQIKEVDVTNNKKISNIITLNLNPGDYTLALRIKDTNSEKLGIFIETIDLSDKK